MKNCIFACLFILCASPGFSQIGKGRMMAGIDLGFQNQKAKEYDTTGKVEVDQLNKSLNLGLKFGYFLNDHVAVGIYGGMSSGQSLVLNNQMNSSFTISNKNDKTYNGINVGLFGRYYQMLGKSRFAAFGQLAAGYSTGKSENLTYQTTTNTTSTTINIDRTTTGSNNGLDVMLRPGIAFFLTDMVAFEAQFGGLGYGMSGNKEFDSRERVVKETTTSGLYSTMNLNFSSLTFGLTFYFGGSGGNSENHTDTNK